MHEFLIIIGVLFVFSMTAAYVLFKVLKNTAVVKLPYGHFGGAIAGFIGVFILLFNSYNTLAKPREPEPIKLDLPPNYKTFISRDYGLAFGYPKGIEAEQELEEQRELIWIKLGTDNDGISVMAMSCKTFDLKGIWENDETRKELINVQCQNLQTLMPAIKLYSMSDYSIKGTRAIVLEGEIITEDKTAKTIFMYVPNFERHYMYSFLLTTSPENFERNVLLYRDIISTMEFVN